MIQLIAISDIYWLLLFGHVNNFFPIIYAIEPACLGNDFFFFWPDLFNFPSVVREGYSYHNYMLVFLGF